ncbi:hypothetical protein Atai01_63740 [Amycolatopsis taiwanensis]|uniref:Uncharacterized protein n=1 Tax=Amycolatopsis taiwanensis TaxID=342230 RepID=A0A9W6VIJ4_9PSEU|nr:hypothetical protein Atai01_63740 [Amycolatopsis taiwanensis]
MGDNSALAPVEPDRIGPPLRHAFPAAVGEGVPQSTGGLMGEIRPGAGVPRNTEEV